MKKKNHEVNNTDLCAMGLTDPVERKIMATSMKTGQDQINIFRESKKRIQKPNEDESE